VREEQAGPREVPKVVRAELHLEAVRRAALRHRHQAGVVDEQVERAVPLGGEAAHRGQVAEVEVADLDRAGHGHLREALLDAGERALARDGVSGLSLRELAKEIGVSHAAPRRHFEDRQALLDALAEHGFHRLGAQLREALTTDPDDFAGRLRAVGLAYFRFATQHAALLEVMYAGKHGPGPAAIAAAAAAFAAPLEVVEHAMSAGRLRAGEVTTTTTLIWAALHGLASLAVSGLLLDQDVDSLVEQTVDALLIGLVTDGPAGGAAADPIPSGGPPAGR